MKDLFKKMHLSETAPETLKKAVLGELEVLRFMGEVIDLFTTQFIKTELEFIANLDQLLGEKEEGQRKNEEVKK